CAARRRADALLLEARRVARRVPGDRPRRGIVERRARPLSVRARVARRRFAPLRGPAPRPAVSAEPRGDGGGWLDWPWVPALLAGLATALLSWWVWGMGPDPVAVVHDESAYRLQAGIFAGGRWADPAPPLEGFFDQVHVLSNPARAAKYQPGHALTLAPGFGIGAPVAVPLL